MTVEQIKAWLLSKGVTLWASWDLSQPERLHEAAEWLYAQMDDLSRFVVKAPPYSWDRPLLGSGWKEQAEHYGQGTSWDVVA